MSNTETLSTIVTNTTDALHFATKQVELLQDSVFDFVFGNFLVIGSILMVIVFALIVTLDAIDEGKITPPWRHTTLKEGDATE